MIDLERLETDAFHYLPGNPDYSRRVLALIEETRKAREFQVTLEKIIDDDHLIINGIMEDYKILEHIAITAKQYREGKATAEDFDEAWCAIARRLAKIV